MAKAKVSAKGQKSITSFFGGGKKTVPKDEDESDVEDIVESSDVEIDEDPKLSEVDSLPPIHDISQIFSDLIGHTPQIKPVVEYLQGRSMRVATMCSGTESPLLALELIRRSILEHYEVEMKFEHVFSCEIEPFKQAYIERNFHPPILFRDVCELGDDQATTAYGSLVDVPGDVDLLVAGTSCVDYSNLNNQKQTIDAQGESGKTFRGMMSWVKKHQPPLVILENVCSAPWDRVVGFFEDVNYSASWLRVDTKTFYIPHTRTRVYLLAVNQKKSSLPSKWKEQLGTMKRPASSTLDAFLLPADDPRVHLARQKLVAEAAAGEQRRGRIEWGRCESRHQRARLEEELGLKRPLTSWEEGRRCKLPDFAWNDWGHTQVERVWDLLDISLLRSAAKGIDPSYKSQVWNLSQNVDRTISSGKVGICPCLTPSMIPYVTNRGGPMTGIEALAMQGLPVDELLLTREKEDQLADLAGNAMSTTVVGACILSALIVGRKLLKKGSDRTTYESHTHSRRRIESDDEGEAARDVAMQDGGCVDGASDIEEHISGEDQLSDQPLDLVTTSNTPLKSLLTDAQKSIRLCDCEGRKDITDRQINRCKGCGSSSCVRCGGKPEHDLEPIDVIAHPRISPTVFAKTLKSTLPMSLKVPNVTRALLDGLRGASEFSIPDKRWSSWSNAVLRAVGEELRFVEPKRQEIWMATYQSTTASLQLLLNPQQPEWRLFAKPEDTEPAKSELRKLLEFPVGRFSCVEGLFDGQWDFALPVTTSISITFEGSDLVPSWESKIGLQHEEFRDKLVHSQITVTVADEDKDKLERDVSGKYSLLDKCGTASSALHRRQSTPSDADLPPLFFFLDPSRCGDPKDDGFVFSISARRYEYGESRPIVCQLDPKWRQSDVEGPQKVKCNIPYIWAKASRVRLAAAEGRDASYSTPSSDFQLNLLRDSCRSANALLVLRVPLRDHAGPEWPRGEWREVDRVHERGTFKALAWLTERIKNVDDRFVDWQVPESPPIEHNCERCAPTPPEIKWALIKKKAVAIEDVIQAGEYERALKRRPTPFVTQLKLGDDEVGTVRIGLNMTSLMHRAWSRLPTIGRTEKATLSWRLQTDFFPVAEIAVPKFALSSNRQDSEHSQPPSFRIPLRTEQLRSLTWMIQRESQDVEPFIEEEISEAVLEALAWRAEGRAQRPIRVRGGVLADEVGYGKTAITLGLIDCKAKEVAKEFAKIDDVKGKIPVKASLIIVPPHLTRQWNSEVQKFTRKRFKVVVLSTASSLNSVTIENIQDADIVIVASNLFKSNVYLDNLETLAAAGSLPSADGRFFNARLDVTLNSLAEQVERLKNDGSSHVMDVVQEASKKNLEAGYFVPSKRLKGKAYRDAAGSKEEEGTAKPKAGKAKPHKGKIMEVVIPMVPKRKVSPRGGVTSSASSDVNSDTESRPTKRRRAVNQVIVISDEDDAGSDFEPDEDDGPIGGKRKRPLKISSRSSAASPPTSDYEETPGEENSDSEEEDEESEDDTPKKVRGKSTKAPAKARRKVTKSDTSEAEAEATSDDVMDVDDDEDQKKPLPKTKKGKATKAKSSDDEGDGGNIIKKKKRREDTDPWKLKTTAVKKDWTQMKAPPLEMFHWARKVVDEYTYLDGKVLSMVTRVTADRLWVLSGTPPIHDFLALKTISAFMGVHLGIDDEGEGQASASAIKKRYNQQSASERFHSFREVHTLEWHAHRHEVGQTFLDQFVRQNIAEIDEIPSSQKIRKVDLPAAERAIYLELEHHLRALDMTVKRAKKSESDREKRLNQALGDSKSAEEALLKRCSHFDLETSGKENAMKACEVIVQERTQQLDKCKASLTKMLQEALRMEKKIGKLDEETLFREYVRISYAEGVGDVDASKTVKDLLKAQDIRPPTGAKHGDKYNGRAKDAAPLPSKVRDIVWELREHTHEIRRVTKELVGRLRSLRYFTVVRDLQKQNEKPPVVSCPSCERTNLPTDEVAVLSSCGHMGCLDCVTRCAEAEECVYRASGECGAAARVLNVVRADTLGVDDVERDGKGKHYGLKLEKVIDLIKKQIPSDERVLVFVQFPDLMKKVSEAFTAHRVTHLEIKGSASQKSKNLEKFQQDSKERVLLLNVMDESASGANLTSANHAIFLSPLLAPSQEIYNACETQAIGRLRRFGQTKHVYIHRFLSLNTIDVEIYEDRAGTTVV